MRYHFSHHIHSLYINWFSKAQRDDILLNKKPDIHIKYSYKTPDPLIPGFYFLCLTLFSMPFPRSWSLYPLGAALFFGTLAWIKDHKNLSPVFNKKLVLLLPLMFYFAVYSAGLIFDRNLTNVVDKLMFILVPVCAFPIIISGYARDRIRIILLSYISGIFVISVYQLLRASYESISFAEGIIRFQPYISPGLSRFNWEQLSTFEHPTYITIKALWAFTLVLFASKHLKINIIWKVAFITFFSLFIYFLAVRSGFIILLLLVIIYIFKQIKKLPLRIIFILLIPLFVFSLSALMRTNERMNYWYNHVQTQISAENVDWKDIEPRTRAWFSSVTLIKERPLFGYGLNARDILAEEYRRQGYDVEADLRLNSHNQFLETQLTFGIPGTVILLSMLLIPFAKRKIFWNTNLIIPFLLINIISMVFESILVRQWGIMFFVLFYCILTVPDSLKDS